MINGYLVLCDFAESDPRGKVHLMGAGWSETGPAPAPHAVVLFLQVPVQELQAEQVLALRFRLVDSNGNAVQVPGPTGSLQDLNVRARLEVQRKPGPDDVDLTNATFSMNISPLPLPPGRYHWIAEVDDKEIARTYFKVRDQMPPDLLPRLAELED